MWLIARRGLACMQLCDTDPVGPGDPLAQLRSDIGQSQRLLDGITGVLDRIEQLGMTETPEYREIVADRQRLSRMVTEATRQEHEIGEQQAQQHRSSQTAVFLPRLTGIAPIRSTLGSSGQGRQVGHRLEVESLQRFLTALGIEIPTTGVYDAQTRAAVQQFQGRYQLKSTGTVGAETRQVINDLLRRASTPEQS